MTRQPRHARRPGFTLVEVLVVVIVIAILAGIAMPTFTQWRRDANKAATEDTVRCTREAITLYREYTGQLPDLITNWDPLTAQTTVNGRTVGPFLNGPPRNGLAAGNPSCITDGDGPVLYTNTCSFLYDYNGGGGTGRFIASFDPGP